MFRPDVANVFIIGLLFLCVFNSAYSNEIPKDDLKRINSPKERTITADATEERPQVYQEHYNAESFQPENKEGQHSEEENGRYSESQRDSNANANQYAEHSGISLPEKYAEHSRIPDRKQYAEHLSDLRQYEERLRSPDRNHYEESSNQNQHEDPSRIPDGIRYVESPPNQNHYEEHQRIPHRIHYVKTPNDHNQYEEPPRVPDRTRYAESPPNQNQYEEPPRIPDRTRYAESPPNQYEEPPRIPDRTRYAESPANQNQYEEPSQIPGRIEYAENPPDVKKYEDHATDKTQYVEAVRIPHSKRKQYTRSESDDQSDDDLKEPQAYKFGYEIKDHHQGHQYRHEQKDEKGNIQGRFGYRDPKGQYRQVNYVADVNGFRAKIQTNEAGIVDEDPADVKIQKDQEVTADGNQDSDASGKQQMYDHVGSAPKEYSRKAIMEDDEEYSEDERDAQHRDYMHHGSHIYHPYPSEKHVESEPNKHQSEEDRPASFAYRHYYKNKLPHGKSYMPHEEESEDEEMSSYHHGKYHYRREPKDKKYSTYQYELGDKNYNYELDEARDSPRDGRPYRKEYLTHKPVVILENDPPTQKEPEMHHLPYYDAYRNPDHEIERTHKPHDLRLILPQTDEHGEEKRFHTVEHGIHDGHGKHSEEKQYKRPIKEYRIKFEKQIEPAQRVIPAIHQYIQIINEQDQPKIAQQKENNPSHGYKPVQSDTTVLKNGALSYKYEPVPSYPTTGNEGMVFRYEPVPPNFRSQTNNQYEYVPDEQPGSHSKSNEHEQNQMQIIYSDKPGGDGYKPQITPSNFERKPRPNPDGEPPSYANALPLVTDNADQKDHPASQQAVLEIDADVYKQLFESKSPGQKLVAIPVNAIHGGHAKNADAQTSSQPKPHGILHIPLDSVDQGNDLSKIFNKLDPHSHQSQVILHPANAHNGYSEPSRAKSPESPSSKDHAPYRADSNIPSGNSRGKYVKDKDYADEKWIPLAPRSKQRLQQIVYGTEAHSSLNVSPSISNSKVLKLSSKENDDKIDLLRKPQGVPANPPTVRQTRYVLVSPLSVSSSQTLKKL